MAEGQLRLAPIAVAIGVVEFAGFGLAHLHVRCRLFHQQQAHLLDHPLADQRVAVGEAERLRFAVQRLLQGGFRHQFFALFGGHFVEQGVEGLLVIDLRPALHEHQQVFAIDADHAPGFVLWRQPRHGEEQQCTGSEEMRQRLLEPGFQVHRGRYHTGEDQARSWMVMGRSIPRGSRPSAMASNTCWRGVGICRTRT